MVWSRAIDSGPLGHYRPWIDDIRREERRQKESRKRQLKSRTKPK
jgi:hypothetical protein